MSSPARSSAAGLRCRLPPGSCEPIALALHELMSNALSHGALASHEGTLWIDWTIEDGRTQLHWRERGGPCRVERVVEGLGLTLVRGVVERQLGGALRLDWAEQGLDAWLTFKTEGTPRAANDGRRQIFRSVS